LYNDHINAIEVADYKIQYAGIFQLGADVNKLLEADERAFLSAFISDELANGIDSMLCREVHHYATPASMDKTVEVVSHFYKGLCNHA
jgi:hypothetical protein